MTSKLGTSIQRLVATGWQVNGWRRCGTCRSGKLSDEFYRKGDRTDSRCRPCVLGIKRRTRQQRKAARTRKPRGRVIDISSVTFNVIPAQIGRAALEQWTEFTMGE